MTTFSRYGTFDYQSAKQTLDELKDGVNGLADHLGTLARMLIASVASDRETAKLSLNVSYVGLGLIVLGFLLQIASYVW